MLSMKMDLYKKENNIFQSEPWLDFQKAVGREIISQNGHSAIALGIGFGKKFALATKSDFDLGSNQNNLLFIRIEPGTITKERISKYHLKKVTGRSLLSGQKSPVVTRALDISKTEEEILAQMKPKTRYNIRLAQKKGVTVSRTSDADTLYNLLQKTAGRDKGYFPHDKNYYQKMAEVLGSKNLGFVFQAEFENEPLAAIFVTLYGKTAIYLHGGFDDSKKNLMAPYLCQWEAIKYAKKMGCSYYDFWGVAETDSPHDPWAGITRFKEGFGGERIVFPGSYDFVLHPFWYNFLTVMARIKHLIR